MLSSSALSNSRSSSTATLRSASISSSTLHEGTGDTITSETSTSGTVGTGSTGSTITTATTTTTNTNNNNNNTTNIRIVNKNGIVLQGYIKKMKTMRKKYFILYCDYNEKSARLEYFDTEKKFKSHYGDNPKRSIKLKSCFHINRRLDTKHKYVIALYTKDDCFCIVFETETEMTKWLKELQSLHHDGGEDEHSRIKFEHVWQVQVQRKGLAEEKRLIGNYHLCLTDKSLTLARTGPATTITGDVRLPNVEFLLTTIRRSGASQCFFYMEVGRHSAIGAGELWMETEDPLIAQNMYATIMNAMTNSGNNRNNKDDFRIRSSSANEASKPIYVSQSTTSQFTTKPFNCANSSVSRERCDSLPTRNRTTTVEMNPILMQQSSGLATIGQPLPLPITLHQQHQQHQQQQQQQQQARILAFTRPHSMYNHRHNSHSPPINSTIGGPLSPSTNSSGGGGGGGGGYSESDGSSLSIDETDGYVYSEDGGNFSSSTKYVPRSSGSIIPEEILDDQWFDSAKIHFDNLASSNGSLTLPITETNLTTNIQQIKNSPQQTAQMIDNSMIIGRGGAGGAGSGAGSGFLDMNSPCGSLPGDQSQNSYTQMSPCIEYARNVPYDGSSSAHSRTSSLIEDMVDVPHEEYMDMDPQSNRRNMNINQQQQQHQLQQQIQYGMNSMSSGASSCSVTSGTPSTDLRFAEYHLDKVVSRFTPDDEDINSNITERPHRAYSVGSRLEHNKRKNVRVDALTTAEHNNNNNNNSNTARIRAFSVGSRVTKNNPRIGTNSNTNTISTILSNISPQDQHHHHNTLNNCGANQTKNKKSSSVPILINKHPGNSNTNGGGLAGTSAGTITTEHPMDDLMEIDFSKRSDDGFPSLTSTSSTVAIASLQNNNVMSTPLKINVPIGNKLRFGETIQLSKSMYQHPVTVSLSSSSSSSVIRNDQTNTNSSGGGGGGIKYSSQFGYVEMKPALPNLNTSNLHSNIMNVVQLQMAAEGGGGGGKQQPQQQQQQPEFDYIDMTRSSGSGSSSTASANAIIGNYQTSSINSLSNSPIKSPRTEIIIPNNTLNYSSNQKPINLSLQDMCSNDDDDDVDESSLQQQPSSQSIRYFPPNDDDVDVDVVDVDDEVHHDVVVPVVDDVDEDDAYLNMSPADISNMLDDDQDIDRIEDRITTKRNVNVSSISSRRRIPEDVLDKHIILHDLPNNSGTPEGYMEMSFGGGGAAAAAALAASKDYSMDTNNNNIINSDNRINHNESTTIIKSKSNSRYSSLPITIQLNRFNARNTIKNITTSNSSISSSTSSNINHHHPHQHYSSLITTQKITNNNNHHHRTSLSKDNDGIDDDVNKTKQSIGIQNPPPIYKFTQGSNNNTQTLSSQKIIKKNSPIPTQPTDDDDDDEQQQQQVNQSRTYSGNSKDLKLSNENVTTTPTTTTTKLPAMPIVVTLSQQPQSTRMSIGDSVKYHHHHHNHNKSSYMDVINNDLSNMTVRNRSGSDATTAAAAGKHSTGSATSTSTASATSKDSDYIDFNPSKDTITTTTSMPPTTPSSSSSHSNNLDFSSSSSSSKQNNIQSTQSTFNKFIIKNDYEMGKNQTTPPLKSETKKSILIQSTNPVQVNSKHQIPNNNNNNNNNEQHRFKSIASQLDERLIGQYNKNHDHDHDDDDVDDGGTDGSGKNNSKIRSLSLSSASSGSSSSSITELPNKQLSTMTTTTTTTTTTGSSSLNSKQLQNIEQRRFNNNNFNLKDNLIDDSGYELLKRTDGLQLNMQHTQRKRISLTRPNSVNSDKICMISGSGGGGGQDTNGITSTSSTTSKHRGGGTGINPLLLNSKRPNSVNSDRLPSTISLNNNNNNCFSSTSSSSSSSASSSTTLCGGGGGSNSQSPLFILSSSSSVSGFGGGQQQSTAAPATVTAAFNISTTPTPSQQQSTSVHNTEQSSSSSFSDNTSAGSLLLCSSRPESVSSIIDLQLTTSRPSSVSSDRELHYASLDLPTTTTTIVNVQTTASTSVPTCLNTNLTDDNNNSSSSSSNDDTTINNNNSNCLLKKNSLSGESSASPSPSANGSHPIEQPAFTYAQIDFVKSENMMKLSKKQQHQQQQQRICKKK